MKRIKEMLRTGYFRTSACANVDVEIPKSIKWEAGANGTIESTAHVSAKLVF